MKRLCIAHIHLDPRPSRVPDSIIDRMGARALGPALDPHREVYAPPCSRRMAEHLGSVLRDAGVEPKRRRLYSLIDEGDCDEALAARIADALGETDGAAFRETLERSGIQPTDLSIFLGTGDTDDPRLAGESHLCILHERRMPKTLFIVALTAMKRWKVLNLPADTERCSAELRRRSSASGCSIIRTRMVAVRAFLGR